MTSQLNPYISFKDNARQALEFYQSVLGGELTLTTFGDFGQADAPEADLIMHGSLQTPNGYTVMGADTPPQMEYTPGSSITVSISGDDDGLRGYWEQLSDGGTVTVQFEKQMWGDEFGMCVDKFGVAWMINIVAPQA